MIISKKEIMFQWTKHFNMTFHVPCMCPAYVPRVVCRQCNAMSPSKHCTNVTSKFNINMGRFMTIIECWGTLLHISTSREIPMHVCSARCPGGGVVQCTLYPITSAVLDIRAGTYLREDRSHNHRERRRPLLGHPHGWKHLLALSHLWHY